jgi:hypothetical protein
MILALWRAWRRRRRYRRAYNNLRYKIGDEAARKLLRMAGYE